MHGRCASRCTGHTRTPKAAFPQNKTPSSTRSPPNNPVHPPLCTHPRHRAVALGQRRAGVVDVGGKVVTPHLLHCLAHMLCKVCAMEIKSVVDMCVRWLNGSTQQEGGLQLQASWRQRGAARGSTTGSAGASQPTCHLGPVAQTVDLDALQQQQLLIRLWLRRGVEVGGAWSVGPLGF